MPIADVILLLGQSNAIGFSTAAGTTPFQPYPGGYPVQTFGAGWAEVIWNSSYSWVPYNAGFTSYNIGNGVCWGPEASLMLAKRPLVPQRQLYLFKYCVGGVGLSQSSGAYNWSPYSSGLLWDSFYAALGQAMSQLLAFDIQPLIDEIYFVGNESDCFSLAAAQSLTDDLPAFVRAIRLRFGSPDAKFIIVRTKLTLGSAAGPLPFVTQVQAAQMALASALPRVAWVNADDIPSGSISAGHYDPAGYVTLGTRMQAAAAGMGF